MTTCPRCKDRKESKQGLQKSARDGLICDSWGVKQMSLAQTGFELVTKRTRKREFLDEMNLVIPWIELLALIAPHAPAGKTGRPPFATEMMLRIHLYLAACEKLIARFGPGASRAERQ
jgi:hypothetical protein